MCSTTQRIKEACLTEQRENAEEKQECSVAEYPWVANLLVLDHKQAGHGEYDRDKEEVENTKQDAVVKSLHGVDGQLEDTCERDAGRKDYEGHDQQESAGATKHKPDAIVVPVSHFLVDLFFILKHLDMNII